MVEDCEGDDVLEEVKIKQSDFREANGNPNGDLGVVSKSRTMAKASDLGNQGAEHHPEPLDDIVTNPAIEVLKQPALEQDVVVGRRLQALQGGELVPRVEALLQLPRHDGVDDELGGLDVGTVADVFEEDQGFLAAVMLQVDVAQDGLLLGVEHRPGRPVLEQDPDHAGVEVELPGVVHRCHGGGLGASLHHFRFVELHLDD